MVIRLDNMFGDRFPASVKENLEKLNKNNKMQLTIDNNQSWVVTKRYWKSLKIYCGCSKTVLQVEPIEHTLAHQNMPLEKRKKAL